MAKEEISINIDMFSTFVINAVDEGSLFGTSSPPPVAANRLRTFRSMLANAALLFNADKLEDCHAQYSSALVKCDGQEPSVDFVKGPSRSDVALHIANLLAIISLEIERDQAYGSLKTQKQI